MRKVASLLGAAAAATLLSAGQAQAVEASPVRARFLSPICTDNGDTVYRLKVVNDSAKRRIYGVNSDNGKRYVERRGELAPHGSDVVRLRVSPTHVLRVTVLWRGQVVKSAVRRALEC